MLDEVKWWIVAISGSRLSACVFVYMIVLLHARYIVLSYRALDLPKYLNSTTVFSTDC